MSKQSKRKIVRINYRDGRPAIEHECNAVGVKGYYVWLKLGKGEQLLLPAPGIESIQVSPAPRAEKSDPAAE